MATLTHLIIAGGPASGREIIVPAEGVRIGRSSRNDISIPDEAMSRFQCRFFFKPGEGLWVSDLGSANGTMVNGTVVQEQRLHLHDEIVAGDTRLRVVNDQAGPGTEPAHSAMAPAPSAPAVPAEPAAVPVRPEAAPAEPVLDLGLRHKAPRSPGSSKPLRRQLSIIVGIMAAATLLAWVPWKTLLAAAGHWGKPQTPGPVETFSDLDLTFERAGGQHERFLGTARISRN